MISHFPSSFETYTWQPQIAGTAHDVPVNVMVAEGALAPEKAQTHVYLGMGEGRFASKAALKTLGRMDIAATAVILPFHHLPCDAANIERTLVEVPQAIAQEMNQRQGSQAPISLLGHSQSGGAALISASDAPELFDHVGVWSPVGLTSEAFGTTLPDRRHEFYKRLLLKNSLLPDQNPLLHPGNLIAGSEIFGLFIADAVAGRLASKLNYALTMHGVDNVAKLTQAGCDVAIFGGQNDPLFKEAEYRAALSGAGLEHAFQTMPGSHCSPLTKPGRQQLEIVGNWLLAARSKNSSTNS